MSLRGGRGGRGGDVGRGLPVGGMYGLGRDAAAAYGLQAYPTPYAAYAYPGAPVPIPGRTMVMPGGRAPNGASRGRGGGRGGGGRGGAGGPNPRPAAPREGGPAAADDVLKVAGSSNVKSLAGAIANRIREGGQSKAVALGAASVNQTVKALAIARAYLENDQLDLAVRPEFIHIPGQGADEPQRSALRFNVVSRPPGQLRNANSKAEEANNASEVKIAGSTSPLSAAGAIAKRVREGKKCTVVAMGADSVNQAVKAIAIGRTYLEEDMLDINFKPRFVHVDIGEGGDEKKSAVEMTILINQL